MTKIKLIYNPFTVKTDIEINGLFLPEEEVKKDELFKIIQGRRIQQWIDSFFNVKLFERFNENEIEFEFEGTDLGVEDVRSAVNYFNESNLAEGLKIIPSYIALPANVDEKAKKVKALFKEAQNGPFDEFRSEEMHLAFEKAFAPEFDVTVLATMSAGKSTVINATVGKEVLPSKNEACTATIARMINDDSLTAFQARRLNHSAQVLDAWRELSDKDLLLTIEKWNDDEETSKIEVKGDIPEIKLREGIQLAFVDTPGPNNSNDASHRAATVKAINSSQPSMVLYILNSTQLGVEDDKELLDLIRDAMSQGGREAHDRFIFIANKIDMLDSEKESVSGVINNVKKYLEKNGIINPLVIPVSAELAKLIRIKRNSGEDALTRRQKRLMEGLIDQFVEEDEMNLLEQVKKDIDRKTYSKLNEELKEAKASDDEERIAEILSGIPIIETLLDNYLTKHAVPSRIKDAIHTFSKVAHESKIIENTNKILQQGEKELDSIIAAIKDFEQNEERIQKAKEFKESVRSIEYNFSKEAIQRRRETDRKLNNLIDEFAGEFENKLEPTRAKGIMQNAERKVNSFIAETQELLSEDLEQDQIARMASLRDDYQKYVSDLLDDFPEGEAMRLAKNLQKNALEMPDVSVLIGRATFEEKKMVFKGTERHGFLWLKKRDVYETTYEDKVDMSEVGKEFNENLQKIIVTFYREFEEASRFNFEESKSKIILHMDALDRSLELILNKLKEMNENKEAKDREMQDNKNKIDWFNDFSFKLNSFLEIK